MKKRNASLLTLGLGIACLFFAGWQFFRGLSPWDYIPLSIIGLAVIASGYIPVEKDADDDAA